MLRDGCLAKWFRALTMEKMTLLRKLPSLFVQQLRRFGVSLVEVVTARIQTAFVFSEASQRR